MEARLEAMSQIIAQGEREAQARENPPLGPEVTHLAEAKRWTLDDPPNIPTDPLR